VTNNFQIGKKKTVHGYENVTQNVLLLIESILNNAKQLQDAHLRRRVRCPSGVQVTSNCSPAFAV
jgi:hypothetical protein